MELDIALACACKCAGAGAAGEKLAGWIDLTPASARCRPIMTAHRCRGKNCSMCCVESNANCRGRRHAGAEPDRAPAAVVAHPEAELGCASYRSWCGLTRRGVPRSRVHPAHQRARSEDDVRRIVFDASYLVLGLGDVYLGAPVATPLDPRHRLVTTKYNPARTWTPENAVGIGGAYMCIYGMEGPGGYQLFGRTIQMWNTWRTTPVFKPGHPWLLRFFRQDPLLPGRCRELREARAAFPHGKYDIRIEDGESPTPTMRRHWPKRGRDRGVQGNAQARVRRRAHAGAR